MQQPCCALPAALFGLLCARLSLLCPSHPPCRKTLAYFSTQTAAAAATAMAAAAQVAAATPRPCPALPIPLPVPAALQASLLPRPDRSGMEAAPQHARVSGLHTRGAALPSHLPCARLPWNRLITAAGKSLGPTALPAATRVYHVQARGRSEPPPGCLQACLAMQRGRGGTWEAAPR